MSTGKQPFSRWSVLGLMTFSAGLMVIGIWVGSQLPSQNQMQLPVYADTAARGENISMATGLIDDGTEGLFVLDHQTGLLQCWILNNQTGAVAGIFRANVGLDLKIEKAADADFVISTGHINFVGARGNMRPASTICYVADGNTGRCVGYGLQFNSAAMNARQEQGGELNIVCQGLIREGSRLRDQ